ncbi:MAG: hypothetical protein QF599_14005, partial [Planctomycetota bacterium]|nr:hypothetical protein [Planctomycetota bacterium]
MRPPTYRHTQDGHWYLLLLAISLALLVALRFVGLGSWIGYLVLLDALFMGLLAASFRNLTVEDRGDHLRLRFGPLRLLPAKRIPYSTIKGARAARSTLMAGWGIHWSPRGWIWNISGFDCVELDLPDKRVRIGTDD